MQKHLLYRKGLRIADIEQEDVKDETRQALADWIALEGLSLDETGKHEPITFRFIEMRGYMEGYEGSGYWISFSAHRPYLKKEGHSPHRTNFDLWVYQDHGQWKVQLFKKATLDDDFLTLLQSWKVEEKPHLLPLLKEEGQPTTTDDIFVDVLQRLQKAHARLEVHLTYEEDEHIEEDDDGNETYIPTEDVEVWFMIEDEIKLYEQNKIVLANSAFNIDDLEEAGFGIEATWPSPLDFAFSIEERIEQTMVIEMLCALINELADMGCEVTIKENKKDDASMVRVLDVEYSNSNDGLDEWDKFFSRGKYVVHYISFPEDEDKGSRIPFEIKTTECSTSRQFWVWYDREDVSSRVIYRDEDALMYYRTGFLPKIQAARANGEIPSLLF